MAKVKLSIGEVELIEKMTWGVQEQIRAAMLGGFKIKGSIKSGEASDVDLDPAVIVSAKFKTIELCVKKITLEDGKEIPYSKKWMENLSIEDGDILFDAVDKITNPEKK